MDQPQEITIGGRQLKGIEFEAVPRGPGQTVTLGARLTLGEAADDINAQNLDTLRTWSLIAVVGLALASGVGGYVLSGMMLRPVRDITRIASEISATNLSRRINHEGPDDELKALAETFDSMIDRLERSFDQQRRFIENASHELRTPLAAIRMNIEVAEMDGELAEGDYRVLLDTVKQQTERLTRLSDDLLILSTNENVSPELEPVHLGSVASGVVSELDELAARRSVTLSVAAEARDIEAMAEPDRLFRCVLNLVDNAIKYAGEGSSVVVHLRAPGGRPEIAVEDGGAGIAPDQLPNLFDRFYRVDRGRSRREGGTGLGLAIVKELVQNMGGSVDVASTVGIGTTFTIRLQPVAANNT
ncbi:MAG: sensor histidine kinase [Dehalococcoidia bacterium]